MPTTCNDSAQKIALIESFEDTIEKDVYFSGHMTVRYANGMLPDRTYIDMSLEMAFRAFVAGSSLATKE